MAGPRNDPSAARRAVLAQQWARHGTRPRVRTARDAVALGVQLLMLKDACQDGRFRSRVNELGLGAADAARYMAAASWFADASDAFFRVVDRPAKLWALLLLGKADARSLVRGEVVSGLTLEGIEGMTAVQLRAAVRSRVKPCLSATMPVHSMPHLSVQEERLLRLFRQSELAAKQALLAIAEQLTKR